MKRILRSTFLLLGAALLSLTANRFPEATAQSKKPEELAAAAQDILTRYACFKCHGDGKIRGKLNLRKLDKILADKSQKILLAKAPKDSQLIQRIEDGSMPDSGTLPRLQPAEVAVLMQWIAAGAPAVSDKPPDKPVQLALKQDVPPANVTEVLRSRCASCHGGSKPESGLRIFDRQALLDKQIVVAKDAAKSPLYQRLVAADDAVMPPPGGGRNRLAPEEVAAVKAWIEEGAPPLEPFVAAPAEQRGEEYVLGVILKDVRALKDAGKQPERYRYFSFNHLLAQDVTAEVLEANRQALTLIVNHLSLLPTFERPEAIEKTNTVFRLDICKLGWDRQPFKRIDKATNKELGPSTLSIFDLVLLEYPYGAFLEGSETYQNLLAEFLEPAHQVAPVPYLRGDWFINSAGRPPLYEDLLQLPFTLEELEKLLGVDSQDNVNTYRARRAGVTDSGVSKNNRVVERHEARNTAYYWKSFDFSTSRGLQNMFRNPLDFHFAGGEMIWALPNGLQAYLITNHRGARLELAPTDIVTDRFATDKVVRNGLSCMRCHEAGMRSVRDDVRPALDNLRAGAPGFDVRAVRRLYADQKEIDALLQQDARRYQEAVKRLFDGKPPESISHILEQTSSRFLDQPIPARAALAELGLAEPDKAEREKALFGGRQLAAVGLVHLAYGGAVRRDTWEDYYDQVIREVRHGKPLVPLDSVTRHDYQAVDGPEVIIEARDAKTGKKKTTFVADDQVVLVVRNKSSSNLYVEVVGTSIRGFKLVPVETMVLAAGKEYRFPERGAMIVKANIGKELLTVYASTQRLPPPELIRLGAKDKDTGRGMMDRVVHPLYRVKRDRGGATLSFDPATVIKRTIEITTE